MTALIATDLDRTVIYSGHAVTQYGAGGQPLVPVERYVDADASFMTAAAARQLARLAAKATVVPVTTRTVEQYARVRLPGPPPAYAICANGAVLLADGRADNGWAQSMTRACAAVTPLQTVLDRARTVLDEAWTINLRTAAGLFCYAVLDRAALPDGFVAEQAGWAADHGWQFSLQGRKAYWVPGPLTKSGAVAEVAQRVGAGAVYAAGDSLLDADLLSAAHAGIAARHGELVESGWSAPAVQVTRECGVLAGAEIVDWLADRVRTV